MTLLSNVSLTVSVDPVGTTDTVFRYERNLQTTWHITKVDGGWRAVQKHELHTREGMTFDGATVGELLGRLCGSIYECGDEEPPPGDRPRPSDRRSHPWRP
jgi:hypothetical protein